MRNLVGDTLVQQTFKIQPVNPEAGLQIVAHR